MAKPKDLSRILWVTVLLFAATGVLETALAQSPPVQGGESSNNDAGSLSLEAVVVTAQRRSENLQEVPIAVSVVTASTAKAIGLTSTMDLQLAAPALTINQTGGGGAAITMRGVTSSGSVGDESPIAVYLDGQYLAGLPGLYFNLNNIDRVEVLKGPQGTLFGRNSTGGSIQIITKTPDFTPSAEFSVGYGNYDTTTSEFYGTTGLTDHVAIDLAVYAQHQNDGWGTNVYLGGPAHDGADYGIRSKVLWQPTDRDSVVFAVSFTEVIPQALQGGFGFRPGAPNVADVILNDPYNTDANIDGDSRSTQFLFSANATHHFDGVDLASITGYEKSALRTYNVDADFSSLPDAISSGIANTQSITQEFHLSSSTESLIPWIAGIFYDHIDQSDYTINIASQSPLAYSGSNAIAPTNSYAAFGQASYKILPDTKLTAGLRYTIDDLSLRGVTLTQSTSEGVPNASDQESKLTYRVALDQKVADDNMAYVSVGTGFKSGLYSIGQPTEPPARPATVTAYEIGDKAQFLDERLRVNTSLFYNIEDNVQVKLEPSDGGASFFGNAAKVHAKGIDIDYDFVATSALSIQGGLSYLNSKYVSYPDAQFYVPKPDSFGALTLVSGNASGNYTIQSPKFVFTTAATYKVPTTVGNFFYTVSEDHNSGYFFDPQNRVNNPSYDLVNLSVRWVAPSEKWSLRGYVDNTLDRQYFVSDTTSGFGDGLLPAAPRTFGVMFTMNFGEHR